MQEKIRSHFGRHTPVSLLTPFGENQVMPFKRTPVMDRIWDRLWVPAIGSCLIWVGTVDERGRPQISLGGKHGAMRKVHTLMWLEHVGPVPEGKQLNHTCDNKRCVHWMHMYAGTHQQNMADKKRRPISDGTPPSHIQEMLELFRSTNRKRRGVNGW